MDRVTQAKVALRTGRARTDRINKYQRMFRSGYEEYRQTMNQMEAEDTAATRRLWAIYDQMTEGELQEITAWLQAENDGR